LLALLLTGCSPVQTYPYCALGLPALRADQVPAEERAGFEDWTVARVAELRRLWAQGADAADPRVIAVVSELEEAAVDWKTFLVKTTDSSKFPRMAILNHSWFQWRQAADWKRTARILAGRSQPVSHLLADGRVPHSAFYTRTDVRSYTPERLREEFALAAPLGNITITKQKQDGTSEGFFGKDERGVEYIFVFDAPFNPEMQTAAEHVGSTLARVLGWRVPTTVLCTVRGTGNPQYDGRRATATVAVKNVQGGWTYRRYRDRRELRSLTVLGAWLNNVDQTEHNTGVSEPAEGVYTYYVWDFGASLGSFTFRPKWPRLGWQYLCDPIRMPAAALIGPPWETRWRVHSAAVGYFRPEVDPDRWVPFYPNLAFEDAAPADKCWGALRIGEISDDQIRTIVESAQYSYASDAEYVIETLIARRNRIVAHYVADGAAHGPE
jgi:hypothetical protein